MKSMDMIGGSAPHELSHQEILANIRKSKAMKAKDAQRLMTREYKWNQGHMNVVLPRRFRLT